MPDCPFNPSDSPCDLELDLMILREAERESLEIFYAMREELHIAIGNPLRLSPDFPPLHTGHEPFSSSGVPSLKTRYLKLMNYYCKLRLT